MKKHFLSLIFFIFFFAFCDERVNACQRLFASEEINAGQKFAQVISRNVLSSHLVASGSFRDNYPVNIINLTLSLPEIIKDCPPVKNEGNAGCSNNIKIIAGFAVALETEGDVLTFRFQVSGGKVTHSSEQLHTKMRKLPAKMQKEATAVSVKFLWDLSDVEPGTYTLTAAADDGCGFCGASMTKTVIVKECPACN